MPSNLKLFVNYRRAANEHFVQSIRTHFVYRSQRDNVFMDFDTIPPFKQFEDFIRQKVRECDALESELAQRGRDIIAALRKIWKIVTGFDPDNLGQTALPAKTPAGTHYSASDSSAASSDSARRPRQPFEPEMIRIPAGPFLMGSPLSDILRDDGEAEQFELDLDYDYAIGKFPVTVGQFRAFIEAGGYDERRWWTASGWYARADGWVMWEKTGKAWSNPRYWDDPKWTGDDSLPVVGVSWYEGVAYTRWLAEATGRSYRLLTEIEWEKAARGGLKIPDGRGGMKENPYPARIWPWGDEEPDRDRLDFKGEIGHITPVGNYPAGASPYGVQEMAGNVWEWCLSKWRDPFIHPANNNPDGPSPRLLRGGAWDDNLQSHRVSCRYRNFPYLRYSSFGFRVGGVVPVLD